MSDVTPALRAAVIRRAEQRCEYCGLSQVGQEAAFHIDHVVPRAAAGTTAENNLALACVSCSLHKAAKQAAVDPDDGAIVPLFNPRSQQWAGHFRWQGETVVGTTPSGRATVTALKLNRPLILAIRREEASRGRHPHL
ncbi:MAG: HNH endonuclease signature motif containing protein [Tepidisphaeraceae bacterium]